MAVFSLYSSLNVLLSHRFGCSSCLFPTQKRTKLFHQTLVFQKKSWHLKKWTITLTKFNRHNSSPLKKHGCLEDDPASQKKIRPPFDQWSSELLKGVSSCDWFYGLGSKGLWNSQTKPVWNTRCLEMIRKLGVRSEHHKKIPGISNFQPPAP